MRKQNIPSIDTSYKDYKHQQTNSNSKLKQTKHPRTSFLAEYGKGGIEIQPA